MRRDSGQGTSNQQSETTVDPARHHIGRTPESDPEYNEQPARAGAPAAGLIDPHGNDLTASPDLRDTQQRMRQDETTVPEEMKTRLPGDTSSDPHTDLGPDNATVVQQRGKERRRSRRG